MMRFTLSRCGRRLGTAMRPFRGDTENRMGRADDSSAYAGEGRPQAGRSVASQLGCDNNASRGGSNESSGRFRRSGSSGQGRWGGTDAAQHYEEDTGRFDSEGGRNQLMNRETMRNPREWDGMMRRWTSPLDKMTAQESHQSREGSQQSEGRYGYDDSLSSNRSWNGQQQRSSGDAAQEWKRQARDERGSDPASMGSGRTDRDAFFHEEAGLHNTMRPGWSGSAGETASYARDGSMNGRQQGESSGYGRGSSPGRGSQGRSSSPGARGAQKDYHPDHHSGSDVANSDAWSDGTARWNPRAAGGRATDGGWRSDSSETASAAAQQQGRTGGYDSSAQQRRQGHGDYGENSSSMSQSSYSQQHQQQPQGRSGSSGRSGSPGSMSTSGRYSQQQQQQGRHTDDHSWTMEPTSGSRGATSTNRRADRERDDRDIDTQRNWRHENQFDRNGAGNTAADREDRARERALGMSRDASLSGGEMHGTGWRREQRDHDQDDEHEHGNHGARGRGQFLATPGGRMRDYEVEANEDVRSHRYGTQGRGLQQQYDRDLDNTNDRQFDSHMEGRSSSLGAKVANVAANAANAIKDKASDAADALSETLSDATAAGAKAATAASKTIKSTAAAAGEKVAEMAKGGAEKIEKTATKAADKVSEKLDDNGKAMTDRNKVQGADGIEWVKSDDGKGWWGTSKDGSERCYYRREDGDRGTTEESQQWARTPDGSGSFFRSVFRQYSAANETSDSATKKDLPHTRKSAEAVATREKYRSTATSAEVDPKTKTDDAAHWVYPN